MSRLLISGPGHSGGNWAMEIMRATDKYRFTEVLEDRNIKYHDSLYEGYATKITTDYPGIDWMLFAYLLETYPDLKIIFTFRHPLDNCLSKIARGMPIEGNEPFDGLINFSYEATLFGSIKSIECAVSSFLFIKSMVYKDRVVGIRLEDLILKEEEVVKELCKFVDVEYKDDFLGGYSRTNNKLQINRYNRELDTNQVDIYKRWDSIYDGFYKDKKQLVGMLAYLCKDSIELLVYTYEGI